MVKNKYIILLCLLLAGCGDQSSEPNQSFDETGSYGIRVKYGAPTNPRAAFLENVYRQVEACIGKTAAPPSVIFVQSVDGIVSGHMPNAAVRLRSGTVYIENDIASDRSVTWVAAHEFVHWITHYNGLITQKQQDEHDSPLFLDCATPASISVPIL